MKIPSALCQASFQTVFQDLHVALGVHIGFGTGIPPVNQDHHLFDIRPHVRFQGPRSHWETCDWRENQAKAEGAPDETGQKRKLKRETGQVECDHKPQDDMLRAFFHQTSNFRSFKRDRIFCCCIEPENAPGGLVPPERKTCG
ncbi:MAG: hypothetical protein JJU29_01870 [Verrucomicrobia bacterium]|nr:hypothetical protein [Verrucomicrobiota bacterium]MCH8510980.1 hypothetical protein [Kiritimatiellia bacterium]